jgi:hypothetical protein
MQNQSEATLSHRSSPKPFRTTARIVGVLYRAGMVVGIGGTYSSNPFLADRITSRRSPGTACC